MMENIVQTQLSRFIDNMMQQAQDDGITLKVEYDSQWPSLCYQQSGNDGDVVRWQPMKQDHPLSFAALEQALEMTLNEQFCLFFTSYWSENLPAIAAEGECELLQVWNKVDFERLQENLIGHVLMKRRLKQPPTLFFGLTDQDDFILSVDNASGEVVLEQVGKVPCKQLAPDLATFIAGLRPNLAKPK